jgi:hypothetical protein
MTNGIRFLSVNSGTAVAQSLSISYYISVDVLILPIKNKLFPFFLCTVRECCLQASELHMKYSSTGHEGGEVSGI